MEKTFFLTTTLPYVNAPLHMGHALEFIRADTIARYKKLLGFDVYFNTGTDEHGLKIFEKAQDNGISVQDFVDQSFETFKEQIKIFGISEDVHFIRTTDQKHQEACKDFWNRVKDNGYIYKKNYEAKYCSGCESEKTDSDLANGECPEHPGLKIKIINEENYFFKYSEFTNKLIDFYRNNPDFIVPEFRFHEIKNFVQGGLQDFSISRLKEKMPWGIPVPDDDTQVMYVWFDALVNYISTLGWPSDMDNFEKYWKNGNPTQYCGKDNTRFQGAMWQAMLMAAGLPNSHKVVVNGFITGEGGVRMSKTLGNVVDPRDIVKDYGTDALRYFLLREVGNFEDSPFTIERFKESYNSGLANGLGNLISRIMTMAENNNIKARPEDIDQLDSSYQEIEFLETYQINNFMNQIWLWISDADLLIQTIQPFKLIKTDFPKAEIAIKDLLKHLIKISFFLEPFLPETSQKIKDLIKQNKKPEQPLFLRKD